MSQLNFLITKFPLHILSGGFKPISLRGLMSDGVQSDLKTIVIQFIDDDVVGVFMTDVEGGSGWATVGVDSVVESVTVCYNVVHVDAVVEGDCDELEENRLGRISIDR